MARILYIDDDLRQIRAGAEVLNFRGHGVLQATDGLLGLEELLKGPDLVLLDFHMTQMDGLEFARSVREDPKYFQFKSIPIIGIGDFPPEADQYLTEWLPKPMDWDILWELIEKYSK